MKQTRIIFIDYVRAMAILMVLMCHVIDINCMFWLGYQEMTWLRQVMIYALLLFGRCGVPLFLMITGYLLLDRDYSGGKWKTFYTKKWLHLLAVTEIWFVIYEVFSCLVQGNSFVWKDFALRLLFIKEPVLAHAWYLPMILKIYLLIPLVSYVLRRIADRYQGFVAFMVILGNVLLQLFGDRNSILQGCSMLFLYFSFVYAGYCVKYIGVKIKKSDISNRYRKGRGLLLGAGGVIATLACERMLYLQYLRGEAVHLWYDNICVITLSLLIFVGMASWDKEDEPWCIRILSEKSFDIYLIHNMVALLLLNALTLWNAGLFAKMLVSYVVVLVISLVLSQIVEKISFVGKWVMYK